MTIIIFAVGIAILLGIALVGIYNNLIKLRNMAHNQLAQVEVNMQRRADLIPNLVETVKGYASHEQETLQSVIQARNAMANATTMTEMANADNQITEALSKLMVTVEAYPELKANLLFQQLQTELSNIEEKIAYARQFYNDSVNKYNTSLQSFPRNLIGGMLGFRSEEYFEASEKAKEVPTVSF